MLLMLVDFVSLALVPFLETIREIYIWFHSGLLRLNCVNGVTV